MSAMELEASLPSVEVSLPSLEISLGGEEGAGGAGVGGPGARIDPVGEMRFRVEIAGVEIGWFSDCTGLTAEHEMMEYQPGGAPSPIKLRGAIKYPNIVLKRGITSEDALIKWFFAAQKPEERPDLTIILYGPNLQPIQQWVFNGAFPLKWQGPTLNAASKNTATEQLELAHAGMDSSLSGAVNG
jgi:phage tail-like protein